MNGSVVVLLPRDLLDPLIITDHNLTDKEGLLSVQLIWTQGIITNIRLLGNLSEIALPIAISPLIESHAHLDKAYTRDLKSIATNNITATMLANASEHSFRTAEDLQKRITRIMQLGWHQGLRGIRTHVDSLGPHMQLTWEVLQDLRFNWKTRLSLQLVALLPLYYWGTQKGINLAKQIASSGGFLGGILGPPYIKSLKAESEVLTFLKLAQSFGCSVDLHVDEGNIALGHGVNLITRLMEKYNFDVSITCSHSSSMGLLPLSKLRNLAERMAYVNLQVVALPFTNFWLIGHHSEITPSQRPIAPIKQLQAAGVNVCVGSDNVQDAWFPAGNCDPIELIRFSTVTTHLTPWSRQGLVPFTTSPSRLMGLEWDGIFRIGAPASMILIDCSTWYRILAQPPRRRVLHNGKWILD